MTQLPFNKTALLCGLAYLFTASSAWSGDLLSAYRYALKYDSQLAAARYSMEAGKEKAVQGRSQLLPQVGASAEAGRAWVRTEFANSVPGMPDTVDRKGNKYDAAISAQQPIYRAQNLTTYEQGKLAAQSAELQYRLTEQQLMLRVAKAYFDVLQARDAVTVAASQKEAFSEQLAQAKKRFQVGVATITDTYEAQSRYDATNAQEIAARNDLEVKTNALRQITGTSQDWIASLNTKMKPTLPEPRDLNSWQDMATNGNLVLQAQQMGEQVAKYEVQRNRQANLPTLDLVGRVGKNWDEVGARNGGTDQTRTYSVGLQLNVPIYAGGGLDSKTREAAANYEKSKQDVLTTRRSVEQDTKSAFLGVTSGAAQVQALEQALVSAQSQLDATKTGQQVGVRTNVDVLNAQQQYYQTLSNLLQARYNYLLAKLNLAFQAGKLSESDLESVNKLLVKN
ncbi:TolC family outer membrane protein [Chitinivorax sp. B]|uniref:TolC family outer membrane protein n=1 Tax=Chitinivorax sp. B TaxID=2502235 RepID=UPI001485B2B6|nr:TolC family outer membrane protein [Chitinivorax sp. B]